MALNSESAFTVFMTKSTVVVVEPSLKSLEFFFTLAKFTYYFSVEIQKQNKVNIIAGGNGGEEISVSEDGILLTGASRGHDLSEGGKS
ncbi:MAG: hypothetical protein ACR2IS_01280 [Nitrososphaeraceae archaeon]